MTVYSDPDAIGALLGMTLTAEQAARATDAAIAASDFVEKALDRSWLDADPDTGAAVTGERHTIRGCRIWLKHAPVLAVSSVSVRRPLPNYTASVLTAPTQYELVDALGGHIYVSPTADDMLATVAYTSTERPPAIIREFTGQLAAGMLALALSGSAGATAALTGVRRYTLWGGDLSVEYAARSGNDADGSAPGSTRLPALWADIERLFSRRLVVA